MRARPFTTPRAKPVTNACRDEDCGIDEVHNAHADDNVRALPRPNATPVPATKQDAKAWRMATPEQFVRVWQSASSIAEVVARTGMPEHTVITRAQRYTKQGIPLKRLTPSRDQRRLDVDLLSKIALEVANDIVSENAELSALDIAHRTRESDEAGT